MLKQPKPEYSVAWISKIGEIPQASWDALAMPLKTPFLEWDWLNNLEVSGSATGKTGWLPHHLTVWRDKQLIAGAPLYVKSHSYGEFVFDNQWADLAQRLGIKYYPKLMGMTPFTPAEGYRFLIAEGEDEDELTGSNGKRDRPFLRSPQYLRLQFPLCRSRMARKNGTPRFQQLAAPQLYLAKSRLSNF
jgi:Uncharacterized protein conserved in bacteria